ncbi:MAG TPA: type IV toxin-antitoxin system AbiEi family antitoxin domain-containing protein [Acidimicrobiales bacterium]|jgi:very-short-patch-repair endonuclease|nr:type IV toxin-antitoxin system AbiEi family antitoxin domain-containing protein [Acidimicrobiales bacterium]
MISERVLQLLEAQHAAVARRQLLACGLTDEAIEWVVGVGRLERLRPGVYGLAGAPQTPHRNLMAAILAAGPKSAASHLASAWLYGAEAIAEGPLELTTFGKGARRKLAGVKTHNSTLDPKIAITVRHNVPTVVPPLTVIQLASTCSPLFVERVADDLVKKNWTTYREILRWTDLSRGCRTGELRALCLRALEVEGHSDSPRARRLGRTLLAAGIERFETQFQVSSGEGVIVCDFAWPRPKVALEFNGFRDHGTRVRFDRDAERLCRLSALGWRVLTVTTAMADEKVIGWLRATLAVAQGP